MLPVDVKRLEEYVCFFCFHLQFYFVNIVLLYFVFRHLPYIFLYLHFNQIYTVGHKKRDTFTFAITLANIDRFP